MNERVREAVQAVGSIALSVGLIAVFLLAVRPQRTTTQSATPPQRTATQTFSIAPQIAQVRTAVVHVAKHGVCQGSGAIVSADGIIFSAKHVSDGEPGDYTVTLDDGREFPVKYVVEDTENDVSFMLLDLAAADQEPNLPHVELATTDPQAGDGVIIGGSPLGKDNFNTFSFGIVSATDRNLYDRRGWESYKRYDWHVMVQTTSPAFPGNSGGPIFNMQGQVIGVLVAGQAETLDFGVPVARFRDTIDTVRRWFELCRFNVVEEKEKPVYDGYGYLHSGAAVSN